MVADDPVNDRPKFVLAEWLTIEQKYDQAKDVLDSISREGRNDSRYPALSAKIDLGAGADPSQSPEELTERIAADANNLEARFELARQLIQSEKLSEALDQLLEILKRDRNFRHDEPRQTILKVFNLAGGKGELVSLYRRRLAQVLN